MKFVVIALLACVCIAAAVPIDEEIVLTEEFIREVNSKATTWKAEVPSRFRGMKKADVRRHMGVLRRSSHKLPVKSEFMTKTEDLPDTFDAREQWPKCTSLNDIRDQGSCGSCWAFGAAESITDRVCIANKGASNPRLSADELVACCNGFTCMGCMGCDGGQIETPWSYWHNHGLVTGFLYGDKTTCKPYEIAPCEHHVNGTRPACSEGGSTPKCVKSCVNGADWNSDKHYGQAPYTIGSVEDMMKEIYENGPVEAAYTVYADFLAYKSGVYKHTSGDVLGGHAIKILGWGTEDGTPYWLVANSWNSDWGNNGFFKIARGTDECGIEDDVAAAIPK